MNVPSNGFPITTEQAATLIRESKGMVTVYVVKRKDGSLRRMNGFAACNLTDAERSKVTTGAGMAFDPLAHNLVPFYEMVSECQNGTRVVKGRTIACKVRRTIGKQFRNVAVEGIKAVKAGGKVYTVAD
jgi:hypothetical protein